jgi:hypothetical protein
VFLIFATSVTSAVDVECQDIHQWTKHIKMCIKWRNLSSKTEELLFVKLLTCWEFHFRHCRAICKTFWTHQICYSSLAMCVLTVLCLCMNFWPKAKWMSSHILPVYQISTMWLLSFPRSHDSIEGEGDLMISPWFKQNLRRYLLNFKQCVLQNASNMMTLCTPVYWFCCTALVAHVLYLLMGRTQSPSKFCVHSEICFSIKLNDPDIITVSADLACQLHKLCAKCMVAFLFVKCKALGITLLCNKT